MEGFRGPRRAGRAPIVPALGALALGLLFLVAPLTAAAAPSVKTITAPYVRFYASHQLQLTEGGCAIAKQTKGPNWYASTGILRTAGLANAPHCAAQNPANDAEWVSVLTLTENLHFAAAGAHVLRATWDLNLSYTLNQTPYTGCRLNYTAATSECVTEAGMSVDVQAQLYDPNNGSFQDYGTAPSFSAFIYSQNESSYSCASGPCTTSAFNASYGASGSHALLASLTSVVNATGPFRILNRHEGFVLFLGVYVDCYAYAYAESATGVGKASAAAALDLASGGNAAHLVRITIT